MAKSFALRLDVVPHSPEKAVSIFPARSLMIPPYPESPGLPIELPSVLSLTKGKVGGSQLTFLPILGCVGCCKVLMTSLDKMLT